MVVVGGVVGAPKRQVPIFVLKCALFIGILGDWWCEVEIVRVLGCMFCGCKVFALIGAVTVTKIGWGFGARLGLMWGLFKRCDTYALRLEEISFLSKGLKPHQIRTKSDVPPEDSCILASNLCLLSAWSSPVCKSWPTSLGLSLHIVLRIHCMYESHRRHQQQREPFQKEGY